MEIMIAPAMQGVYSKKRHSIENYLKSYLLVDNQTGFVAICNGSVLGFDLISRPTSYRRLHQKILKSYVMEAILKRGEKQAPMIPVGLARDFLGKVVECRESISPSIGHGTDYRYEKDSICGSALVHEETVIHSAFFNDVAMEDNPPGRMQSYGARARHRRRR
jgi:hypothetical protein